MRHWQTPSVTSPDLYGPNIDIPDKWTEIGFGTAPNIEHNYSIGFSLYGCDKGKMHCREYLMARLLSPTDSTRKYEIRIDVAPVRTGVQLRTIGILFTEQSLSDLAENEMINKKIDLLLDLPIALDDQWTMVVDTIRIPHGMHYMILGNFADDRHTSTYDTRAGLPFAYYYVDNISLRVLGTDTHPKTYASWLPLNLGDIRVLDKIYFDFDSIIIRPESRGQLSQLLDLLLDQPLLRIVLRGHTDDRGTAQYNQGLSERRARAVMDWLARNGIERSRLSFTGHGESKPIASGRDEGSRALNRRVEFEIAHTPEPKK